MNTIETIRAEIERLKEEQLTRNSIGVITGSGVFVNAISLLSFLDTLEKTAIKKADGPTNRSPIPGVKKPL